nr:RNA-directed DNA polymerase, eukaryota [Tanacetum cinerariifolium]
DFHSVIEDSWNNDGISASNSMFLLKNKLKFLKQRLKEWSSIKRRNKDHERKVIQYSLIEIDLRLDKGNGRPDDLTKRANLFRDLKDIDHKDSIDLAQKAKIKWAVEGDENFKFFHGIVNKKIRHLAIKGILVNGEWIENPNRVKSEFYSYYSNLFSAPAWDRSLFDVNFPRRSNLDQVFNLEDMVSNEEIKRAVWDCGSNKSPGPDGFIFEFFKKFWTIVGGDVTNAIKEFFISSSFPKGCNSSFIALIPKVMDAKHLKDFRPISLIGCQYKIIGKILANRLSLVIGDIISQEQTTFIKGRQILDGPLIFNETKVIKSIHGNSGALDNPYSSRLKNSTWIGILKAINKLKVKGVDLMGFYKIVIGNGSTTRFWHDIWYGDICFQEKFKRLFNLEFKRMLM